MTPAAPSGTGIVSLEAHLRAARDRGVKALVPYVTGGYDPEWLDVVRAIADNEDIDPATRELWGNFPQTYSMVGIINGATRLSQRWDTVL